MEKENSIMIRKTLKSSKVTKTIHGLTIEVDVDNKVYFGRTTKVFRDTFTRSGFGEWIKTGEERIKDGTMTLSSFRCLMYKGQISVEKNGEKVTL